MEAGWIAIGLENVTWIALAFVFGFAVSRIGLPPLVGFLATGFALQPMGFEGGEALERLADLGITLLLFTVGLKLNLKTLMRPQVWAVAVLHAGTVTLTLWALFVGLAALGVPLFAALGIGGAVLLAFGFSFSSTVFAVNSLEKAGEMTALHGGLAIGILVMQDLGAVVFLAASTGSLPSPWAAGLLLLVALRPVLFLVLDRLGHGELLILFGLVLAFGGSELFEAVGVKGDLGALTFGVLIAAHPKAGELAKALFGFKDLFLVGFFLSIGLTGQLSWTALAIGLAVTPLVLAKSALFLFLMTRFKLRARTSLLASLNLMTFSEFGLIVVAVGVTREWLGADWLVVMAVALSVSFALAAAVVAHDDRLYGRNRSFWHRFQRPERLPDDAYFDTSKATIAVFGMGRVGSGAYDRMREQYGDTVLGVDFSADAVEGHREKGRAVIHGDPSDADFWEKVDRNHNLTLVMLALPNLQAHLDALEQLQDFGFDGHIAATARYPDEAEVLMEYGATTVFNIYHEAGPSFADHTTGNLSAPAPRPGDAQ